MILIFFGPPGAGKGTQAKLVSKYLSIPHLSTGEILRDKLSQKDVISEKLKLIMERGQLVSDEILNEIISNRIKNLDCKNGFILDGYPRTINQAIFLDLELKSNSLYINKIIEIDIDQNTTVKRILSRSNIENREDDNEESIKTRINKYYSETKPVSEHYKLLKSRDYKMINGDQEIDQIYEDILKILKNDQK